MKKVLFLQVLALMTMLFSISAKAEEGTWVVLSRVNEYRPERTIRVKVLVTEQQWRTGLGFKCEYVGQFGGLSVNFSLIKRVLKVHSRTELYVQKYEMLAQAQLIHYKDVIEGIVHQEEIIDMIPEIRSGESIDGFTCE